MAAISLNHLVYDTANLIRAGVTSDDDNLSFRQIAFWWHNTRSQLIRQDLNKGRSPSDNIIQHITCLEMIKTDASVTCGVNVGCSVFRSAQQIPKPIESANSDLILRISPIAEGSRPFHLIPYERVPYIGFSPFLPLNNNIKAAVYDRYIFLFVPGKDKVIKRINVDIVAEDPTELAKFCNCTGTACYTDDSPYPISSHMIELGKKMIVDNNLKLLLSVGTDAKGDANSTVQPNTEAN